MASRRKVTFNVYGMSYRKENIALLGIPNPDFDLTRSELWEKYPNGATIPKFTFNIHNVDLVPEPDNEADPFAIKILMDGIHVGYISRNSTDSIRAYMGRNDIDHITGFIRGGIHKYMTISRSGNKNITTGKNEYYEGSVTLFLKEGREVREMDVGESNEVNREISLSATTRAAASAGGGCCLIPTLAGVAVITAVVRAFI